MSWVGSISVVFCVVVGIGVCVYYVMPFPGLLLFVKRKCVHSVGDVAVSCHFVLKRVIGEEIDGGVSGGRFVEDAYVKAGWSSSHREV